MRLNTSIISFLVFLLIIAGITISSCSKSLNDGKIIITQAGNISGELNYSSGDNWRYTERTNLVAVKPDKPGSSPEPLTGAFFSACSPDIRCDGGSMLFAAQQNEGDPWQIWEMNLNNFKTRQLTSSPDNSIDPAYLPDGRIVFSRSMKNDSLKAGHTLFSCKSDGTDLRRITFNPHAYFASSILKDGRIITLSRQLYPVVGKSLVMVLRPDGTKAELFLECPDNCEIYSRGRETNSGRVVFIESGISGERGGDIISVSYNRPLHSRINHTEAIAGDFHSAFPLQSGKMIVSYRSSNSEKFALYDFDPETSSLGQALYKSSGNDVLEAVCVMPHERAKKLPSEVDKGVKTGLLLCQDINITDIQSLKSDIKLQKAEKIEIIGIDSSLGVVDVEKDGSFYLKVVADVPFTIRTLDGEGRVIHGPGSWIWLRPNERRGCVGCHEDHESVPANRYALAVRKMPVTIPVHISGIKEKEIELE